MGGFRFFGEGAAAADRRDVCTVLQFGERGLGLAHCPSDGLGVLGLGVRILAASSGFQIVFPIPEKRFFPFKKGCTRTVFRRGGEIRATS